MIRRQQNWPSSRQAEFSGKEMTWCFHCEKDSLTHRDHTTTGVCCVDCGTILFQDKYLEDTTFVKYAAGGTHIADNLVQIQNDCSKSHRRTLNEGCDAIYDLIAFYGITNVDHATQYYEIAVERGFTRGRETTQVAAACLYFACREMKKPFLLIAFSWNVFVSVYALGTVYWQLCKFFRLQDHPFLQVDRSLHMHRCTSGLTKDDNVKKVLNTALHLAVSMKKDWCQMERGYGGICVAAIYVSSLLHGYNLSNKKFANLFGLKALLRFLKVKALHTSEATLGKRLFEFEKAGSLRIQEFIQEMQSCKQFANDLKMLGMTEAVCQYKSGAGQSGFGLCKYCYLEFCGGLDGSQPPAFQSAEAETVRPENGNMKDTRASKDDTLSSIDVSEIISCLVDEEERRLKEIILGDMNPEHTEEEAAATNLSQSDTRKMFHLISEVVARKKEKDKRKRELESETTPEAAAAICSQHFNKGLSSKINYDVLPHLFGDEEPNSKMNRDNDGSGTRGKDITDEENKILRNDLCPSSWFDFHLGLEYAPPQQLSNIPRFPVKRPHCREAPPKNFPKRPPCRDQNQAPPKNVLIAPNDPVGLMPCGTHAL